MYNLIINVLQELALQNQTLPRIISPSFQQLVSWFGNKYLGA